MLTKEKQTQSQSAGDGAERLRLKARRADRVLDTITDAVVTLDRDFRIIYINAEAARINKKPGEDFLGRLHWEEWPAAIGTEFERQFRRAMTERITVHFQERYYVPDAYDDWIEVTAYPADDEDGGGIHIVYRDVTERVQRERREAFLFGLAERARTLTDPEAVIADAVRSVGAFLQVSRCAFGDIDVEADTCTIPCDYCADDSVPSIVGVLPMSAFGPFLTEAYAAGRAVVVRDVRADPTRVPPSHVAAYESLQARAFIGVPVVYSARLVSVLAVHNAAPRRWTTEEVELLRTVMERTWLTVEVARQQRALAEEVSRRREREEHLRRLIASSPDCIKTLELDGTIHSISESGLRLLEIADGASICGADWTVFFGGHEETRQRFIAARDAALAGGEGRFQGFCPTFTGKPKWWDVVIVPLLGADGRPEKLLSTARDITELRQAEEALRERETALRTSEERFRVLVDAMPQIAWYALPDGSVDYYNAGWHQYTGLTLDETRAWGWRRLIHPDDDARAQAAWAEALRGDGSPCEIEYRLRGADGAYRWFLLRAIPMRGDDGKVIRWVGTATDIEERRTAEAERRRLLAEYEGIVSSMTEGVLVASATDGTTLSMNPALLAMHGRAPEHGARLRGTPLAVMYASLDFRASDSPDAPSLPQSEWPLARVLRGEVYRGYEVFVRNKETGRAWWGSYGGGMVRGADGEPLLALVTVRDVTERRRAQADRDALLAQRTRVAETLQRSLLIAPAADSFDGLEVATLYDSASEDDLLGGDWFEVVRLGNGRVLLAVGDNTGKGIQSSLFTAELKFALKAFAREEARGGSMVDPARLLARLNTYVAEGHVLDGRPGESFVCLTAAVVDSATGVVLAASAGMEPPLMLRAATGAWEEIPVRGPILGVMPDWNDTAQSVCLAEGDTLLLFSDGLTEARSRATRAFLGYAGVAEAAADALRGGGDLHRIAARIAAAAQEFAGGAVSDDVCLLSVRLRPRASGSDPKTSSSSGQ